MPKHVLSRMAFVLCLSTGATAFALESPPQAFGPEDRRLIEAGFRGQVRYHPIAGAMLDDPRALLAPDEPANVYRVFPESGLETEETHRFLAAPETSGMRVEYRINEAESQMLVITEALGIFIEGAVDQKEGVRTVFDPPKPLLPRGLAPGAAVTTQSKVRVLDLVHPDKVKHSGELTVTLTHLGSFHVSVPSGQYESVLLRLDSHGKIGPAEITHRQYYVFAEDTGLLAFLESRKVSAFGIYERQQQQAWVLIREAGS